MTGAVTDTLPATDVAGAAARPAAPTWRRLFRPSEHPPRFDPEMVGDLPEPARRWLTHAIAAGTPLARAAVIDMRGSLRLGRWVPFRAVQLHAPPAGYVWAARARLGPAWIAGYDRYADGRGEMNWRLLGRIPMIHAAGPDVDRSAAGRVALDAMLVPTAWLQPAVTWRPGTDPDSVIADWHVDGLTLPVTLTVAADGALQSLTMPRWAQPHGHPWGEYPCGGTLDGEVVTGGVAVPRTMRAGYFPGTAQWDGPAGEFFRAEVTDVRFV